MDEGIDKCWGVRQTERHEAYPIVARESAACPNPEIAISCLEGRKSIGLWQPAFLVHIIKIITEGSRGPLLTRAVGLLRFSRDGAAKGKTQGGAEKKRSHRKRRTIDG